VSATFKVTSPARPAPASDRLAEDRPAPAGRNSNDREGAERLPDQDQRSHFGAGTNPTNHSELYNACRRRDLSNWTLINTPSQWASVRLATIPAGTTLASGAYYLLGLSSSGLAAPAGPDATTITSGA
jgi:hypothetical protein